MSYIQCHFGNSMVDADIFLLQVCATQLPSSIVLPTIFDRYVSLEQMNILFDYLHDPFLLIYSEFSW